MADKKLDVDDITPEITEYVRTLTNRFGDRLLPEAEREVKALLGWGLWNLTAGALAAVDIIIHTQHTIAREKWLTHLDRMFATNKSTNQP
jgi:hypothetical protein